MSYVPKLKEEEALILILQILAEERKGQATVSEVKTLIEERKLRPWSHQDAVRNVERSGAPMWHQIVQNASDRLDADRHFYRRSFIRIVSRPPQKVLQITDEGRKFVERLREFEDRLRQDGYKLFEYLDESPLEHGDAWKRLKKELAKYGVSYERGNEKDDLLRSLRSREYASTHHPNYENADLHQKISIRLKTLCEQPIATSVDAWMAGRNYVGEMANIESKRERALANLKDLNW